MEQRRLADRIRWGNLARLVFVLALLALLVWGPPQAGDPPALPPDVGLAPAPAQPPVAGEPELLRRPRPARGRPRKPPARRHRRRKANGMAPPPVVPPLPPAPPAPVAGGEFGP